MPKSVWARRLARQVLGERFTEWYRRRRVVRNYLRAISAELLERERQLEAGGSGAASERDSLLERRIAAVMERTEILVQELDRRIEGQSARSGQRLSGMETNIAELRRDVESLHRAVEALRSGAVPTTFGGAGDASTEAPSVIGE